MVSVLNLANRRLAPGGVSPSHLKRITFGSRLVPLGTRIRTLFRLFAGCWLLLRWKPRRELLFGFGVFGFAS